MLYSINKTMCVKESAFINHQLEFVFYKVRLFMNKKKINKKMVEEK